MLLSQHPFALLPSCPFALLPLNHVMLCLQHTSNVLAPNERVRSLAHSLLLPPPPLRHPSATPPVRPYTPSIRHSSFVHSSSGYTLLARFRSQGYGGENGGNGGLGGLAGNGGNAGPCGVSKKGGNAGRGGTVVVRTSADTAALLMLCEVNVAPGQRGKGGVLGRDGKTRARMACIRSYVE